MLLSVVLAYANSLHGEFQFDDDTQIAENPRIGDWRSYLEPIGFARNLVRGGRPLVSLSFSLDHAIGGIDTVAYHETNLTLHLVTVLLVFFFTRATLRRARSENADVGALGIAAIFGLHPMQTQAVSYISQRAEVLASLFYLAALLAFVASRESRVWPRSAVAYLLGLIFLVLGMASKEVIVTLPVAYLLYDFYFLEPRPLLRRLAPALPLAAAGLAYGVVRVIAIGRNTGSGVGFGPEMPRPGLYLLTQFRVLLTYLRMIFLPVGQNLDHDYPMSRSLLEPATVGALLGLLLLGTAVVFLYRRARVASFGLLWFFLLLAPTSSVVPIADVINEHRVYLALWGIVVAVLSLLRPACGRIDASGSPALRWGAVGAVLAVLGAAGTATHVRNRVWQTKTSLWIDVAAKSPDKPRAHNNLGNCYFVQQRYAEAIPHYRRALELDPRWWESLYNMGLALDRTGRRAEATAYLMRFVREAPDTYAPVKRYILIRRHVPR